MRITSYKIIFEGIKTENGGRKTGIIFRQTPQNAVQRCDFPLVDVTLTNIIGNASQPQLYICSWAGDKNTRLNKMPQFQVTRQEKYKHTLSYSLAISNWSQHHSAFQLNTTTFLR
jgi:hypothetical protein